MERRRAAEAAGNTARAPGANGEIFDFTFDSAVLSDTSLLKYRLDPGLGYFTGTQFPKDGRSLFGVFKGSIPDRQGEMLSRRRFERNKRLGTIPQNGRLQQADFLLGVHDAFRSGALRYKRTPEGAFLDDSDRNAAPSFARLRELETANRALEASSDSDDPATDQWLRLLVAPGASLGGARPKATVVDPEGHLWIAKLASVRDRYGVGAWELVVNRLAERSGLRVPLADARTFGGSEHTFMTRRFDRRTLDDRIHFASAMTLTGHADGDDATSGASYLEIAEVIMSQGAVPREDLGKLWSRIAFNVMVSNTDDHLRNHGFLLTPGVGWRLSPAYDMNPVPGATGLCLNISESDNALDLGLIRSVAPYFRMSDKQATATIDRLANAVRGWREIANSVGLSRSEQDEMAPAFRAE